MTGRITANRWTLDQFLDKAREIRCRLLRWNESLPPSVVNIPYERLEVRVVSWHEYLETSREPFQNAGHGQGKFVLPIRMRRGWLVLLRSRGSTNLTRRKTRYATLRNIFPEILSWSCSVSRSAESLTSRSFRCIRWAYPRDRLLQSATSCRERHRGLFPASRLTHNC